MIIDLSKAKIGKKKKKDAVKLKTNCIDCDGTPEGCIHSKNRNLNDFKVIFCKEHYHILKYKKIE
jgi:hypothetical protein